MAARMVSFTHPHNETPKTTPTERTTADMSRPRTHTSGNSRKQRSKGWFCWAWVAATAVTFILWRRLRSLLHVWFGLWPLSHKTLVDTANPLSPGSTSQKDWYVPRLPWWPCFVLRCVWLARFYTGNNTLWASVATRACRAIESSLGPPPKEDAVTRQIDVIENIQDCDPAWFHAKYVANPRPVILRGFKQREPQSQQDLPSQPQVPAHPLEWTLEWLVGEYGDTTCTFTTTNDKGQFGVHFDKPLKYIVSDEASPSTYLVSCEQLGKRHPEVHNALRGFSTRDLQPFLSGSRFQHAQIFMQGKTDGNGLSFHCANQFNFFLMIQGAKRWHFVDPRWSYLMYPVWMPSNAFWMSQVLHGHTYDGKHLNDRNDQSPTKVTAPKSGDGVQRRGDTTPFASAADFPLYKYCPRIVADVQEGDVLLNPPCWWHSIQNLTDTTVASATRWSSGSNKHGNNWLFCFTQYVSGVLFKHSVSSYMQYLSKRHHVPQQQQEQQEQQEQLSQASDNASETGSTPKDAMCRSELVDEHTAFEKRTHIDKTIVYRNEYYNYPTSSTSP
eukprot:m.126602 g.126602  ORF g.126602 m.126602 type:complete len:556 (-) comp13838_c0_seq1:239-1906(-)